VVCDIAGGVGAVLAEVLRRRPELRGVFIEAPLVLPEAARYLDSLGLTGRIELRQGDLFGDLRATADVYLLKWILHDWDDASCVRLLRNIAATMPAGAKLVVIEGIQEHARAHSRFSPIDLQMLVVTEGGRARSVVEIQTLMSHAGLRPTIVRRTPADLALLEAVKT
jgi:hypothetical protein